MPRHDFHKRRRGASGMSDRIRSQRQPMPPKAWPAADQEGWRVAQLPKHFADPAIGYATRWKASTRKMIADSYGHFLAWRQMQGQLDHALPSGAGVSIELMTSYLEDLQATGLAPYTIARRIGQVGDALQAIAPATDWRWIRRAGARLQSQAQPVSDIEARLQPAPDVLDLGLEMIKVANQDPFRTPTERAVLHRDGLVVGLLMLSTLRRSNLASIAIGEQLRRTGDGWRLSFAAQETKTGRRGIEFAFPQTLIEPLERYLSIHREVLLSRTRKALPATNALWISKHGTPMTPSAVALQVTERTRQRFSVGINPHGFRHIAATTMATANPEGVTDIMAVLGHTTMSTSERYYNKAKMLTASRRHSTRVEMLRKAHLTDEPD